MNTLTNVLFDGPCHRTRSGYCASLTCEHRVGAYDGRFYITAGHAGFNSTANNGHGYATAAAARKASLVLTLGPTTYAAYARRQTSRG